MKTKGIIAINKPKGWTSFDVCNKLKPLVWPQKIGHLGTLDPMATGVLLVTIGKATKLFDLMQEKEKTYLAEFEFGYQTNTLDSTGTKQEETSHVPSTEEIQNVLPEFVGKIAQIPPKYSAKSVNGQRAYVMARNNVDFELKPKNVEIYSIDFISYANKKLTLKIKCGSGTYIRSIGRDIALKLNSLATMTCLERVSVGNFDVSKCEDVEDVSKENFEQKIQLIDSVLNYPKLNISSKDTTKLLNGQILEINEKNGIYKLNDEHDTIALVKIENFNAKMSLFLGWAFGK